MMWWQGGGGGSVRAGMQTNALNQQTVLSWIAKCSRTRKFGLELRDRETGGQTDIQKQTESHTCRDRKPCIQRQIDRHTETERQNQTDIQRRRDGKPDRQS